MHFRILKTIATSGFLTAALECIELDFGWGSAPDPPGELTVLPRPLAGTRGPTSKGRERKRWEREERREARR